jgi:hypothetical protein
LIERDLKTAGNKTPPCSLLVSMEPKASDLTQVAVTSLYTHWNRARDASSTDAYARTILVRAFIAERRSPWSRRVQLDGGYPEHAAVTADHDARLDIRAALAALAPRQRATVVLRYCFNGRPALWILGGRGIAWEYAPGAWADVHVTAGRQGHGAAPDGKDAGGIGSAADARAAVQTPAPAGTRDLVLKIADAVKYAQRTPLVFDVKLAGRLPAGWSRACLALTRPTGRPTLWGSSSTARSRWHTGPGLAVAVEEGRSVGHNKCSSAVAFPASWAGHQ